MIGQGWFNEYKTKSNNISTKYFNSFINIITKPHNVEVNDGKCCYKVQIDLKKIERIDAEDVNGFCERIDHLYNIRFFTGVLLSRFILNASSLIHQ